MDRGLPRRRAGGRVRNQRLARRGPGPRAADQRLDHGAPHPRRPEDRGGDEVPRRRRDPVRVPEGPAPGRGLRQLAVVRPAARGRVRASLQQRLQQPRQADLGLLPVPRPGPGARHPAAPVPELHGAPPAHRERPGRMGGRRGQDRTRHRRGDGRLPAGPAPAGGDRNPGVAGQPVARPDLPHLPRSEGAGRRRRPARQQGRAGGVHRARRLRGLPAGPHPV